MNPASATHLLQLQHNESYWLLSRTLVKTIKQRLREQAFSTYPSYADLRKELAHYAGVSEEQVCLTPGSDAAIEIITQMLVDKNQRIAIPMPTFYGYEMILSRHNAKMVPILYTKAHNSFIFPLEETVRLLISGKIHALFLCHPNNPLGCSIPPNDLRKILDISRQKDILVVLDEAYFEFGGEPSSVSYVGKQSLLVIRTLSKAFGLSGARVGYCISAPSQISSIAQRLLPWPISHPSCIAAVTLLEKKSIIKRRQAMLLHARKKFITNLRKVGMRVYPSQTNFVLVEVPHAAKAIAILREHGIIVAEPARMTQYRKITEMLASTLRITVPAPRDQKRVLRALSKVV